MKKLLTLLTVLTLGLTLTSCSGGDEPEKEEKVVFSDFYSLHYDTMNYLESQSNNDGIYYANMVEGLLEVDNYGHYKYTGAIEEPTSRINDDGTQTWTFKLNPDVVWFDPANDLEVYAPVVAADYVSGLKYILNPKNNSEVAGIPQTFIKGAAEYTEAIREGKDADFSTVGVKAVDEMTLEYTTIDPMTYFLSLLSYSCFYPVNETYLTEQGSSFGKDGENILINGPYYMTRDDLNSKITLTKNEKYWNADFAQVDELNWIFVPNDSGNEWARLKYENGELSQLLLNVNDESGYIKYVYGEDGSGTAENPVNPAVFANQPNDKYSFGYYINVGRAYYDDEIGYTSSIHTEESKLNTSVALQNQNLRKAILWGLDTSKFNIYFNNAHPDARSRNIYTPFGLAKDANDKDYAEYYIEEFAKQTGKEVADLKKELADGNEYYEDDAYAKELFEKAKTELEAEGITFPILIEALGTSNSNQQLYFKSMYEDINKKFGDYVNFTLIETAGQEEYDKIYDSRDFDFYGMTGWGPDYDDPKTYLDTFTLDAGYMLDFIGLSEGQGVSEEVRTEILGKYTDMVNAAHEFNTPETLTDRYAAFAEAEYYLLNEVAVFIPAYTRSAEGLYVTSVIPKSLPQAMSGLSSSMYKYIRLHDGTMTAEDRENYLADWEAKKAASMA